jgi:hypothetical protein
MSPAADNVGSAFDIGYLPVLVRASLDRLVLTLYGPITSKARTIRTPHCQHG